MTNTARKHPVTAPNRRILGPLYAAGFVTAFGAHSVAANLGGYATGHHASLVEIGVLLAVYDGAERRRSSGLGPAERWPSPSPRHSCRCDR